MKYEEIKKINHSEIKYLTKKDFLTLIRAEKTGNFTEVKNTRLYIKYSCLYCYLLEILYNIYNTEDAVDA